MLGVVSLDAQKGQSAKTVFSPGPPRLSFFFVCVCLCTMCMGCSVPEALTLASLRPEITPEA